MRSGPAGRTLRVVGESRAGAPFAGVLGEGEAVRTSTGAAVPEGADGVLQLELAEEDPAAGTVTTRDEVAAGRNVRAAGSDVAGGDDRPARGHAPRPRRAGRRGVGRPGARARRRRPDASPSSRRATSCGRPAPTLEAGPAPRLQRRGARRPGRRRRRPRRPRPRRLPDRAGATRAAIAAGARDAPGSSCSAAACPSARTTTSRRRWPTSASRRSSGASRCARASRRGSATARRPARLRPARQPGLRDGHVPALRAARARGAAGRRPRPAAGPRAR